MSMELRPRLSYVWSHITAWNKSERILKQENTQRKLKHTTILRHKTIRHQHSDSFPENEITTVRACTPAIHHPVHSRGQGPAPFCAQMPRRHAVCAHIREMGGAPRNPAPRNHLLVWIVKPSGCHCTDVLDGKEYRRVPTPLRSTSPFSDYSGHRTAARAQGGRADGAPGMFCTYRQGSFFKRNACVVLVCVFV